MLFLICLQKIINLRPPPLSKSTKYYFVWEITDFIFSRIKVHCQSRCRQNLSKVYYRDLTNQRQGYIFLPLFPFNTGTNFILVSVVIGRDAIIERDCSAVFVLTVTNVSFAIYMVETESLKELLLHSCYSFRFYSTASPIKVFKTLASLDTCLSGTYFIRQFALYLLAC